MIMLIWVTLPPIKIIPPCIHAHVSPTNPIRVDHRHALEHEIVPQFLRVLVISLEQEFNETYERPLASDFPGVHPAREEYLFLISELVGLTSLIFKVGADIF